MRRFTFATTQKNDKTGTNTINASAVYLIEGAAKNVMILDLMPGTAWVSTDDLFCVCATGVSVPSARVDAETAAATRRVLGMADCVTNLKPIALAA